MSERVPCPIDRKHRTDKEHQPRKTHDMNLPSALPTCYMFACACCCYWRTVRSLRCQSPSAADMVGCCEQDGRQYNIACGQIDIGNALTDMTARMSAGVPQANGELKEEPTMDATDVAKACVYMASLPLEANVLFMTVMASAMPLVGRG